MRSKDGFGYLIFVLLISCQNASKNYPEKLKNIPDGIQVRHNKEYVYAEPNLDDPERYGKYKWHFTTSLSTDKKNLRIIEFGGYIWKDQKWVFTSVYDRPFNNQEFEDWYNCPEGKLVPGKTYTDPNNWSKGNQLIGGKQLGLWYFIAENTKGEKFKGTAEITTVYELE